MTLPGPEPRARRTRLLRAVLATLVVIGLGSWAHQTGGGPPPGVVSTLVLATVVGPLVWVIVRSRTSVPRMALATTLGQVVTHLMLAAMSPTAGGTAREPHLHEIPVTHAAGSLLPTTLHLPASMLMAHAAATVVATLLLTTGDDVTRAALRRLTCPAAPAAPSWIVAEGRSVVCIESAAGVLVGREVRPVGGRAPPVHAC